MTGSVGVGVCVSVRALCGQYLVAAVGLLSFVGSVTVLFSFCFCL